MAFAQNELNPSERYAPAERVSPDLDLLATGSLAPRFPWSDQFRGPAHDARTGTVRPGNPSPSVR